MSSLGSSCRQDRPMTIRYNFCQSLLVTIEVGFRSGSSCDDMDRPCRQDRPLTMRCQSLRPMTMRSNVVVRIVLSSGSSCDDEVEFLQMIE